MGRHRKEFPPHLIRAVNYKILNIANQHNYPIGQLINNRVRTEPFGRLRLEIAKWVRNNYVQQGAKIASIITQPDWEPISLLSVAELLGLNYTYLYRLEKENETVRGNMELPQKTQQAPHITSSSPRYGVPSKRKE